MTDYRHITFFNERGGAKMEQENQDTKIANHVLDEIKSGRVTVYRDDRFEKQTGYTELKDIEFVGVTRNNRIIHLSTRDEYYSPVFLEYDPDGYNGITIKAYNPPQALDFKIYMKNIGIKRLVNIYNEIADTVPGFQIIKYYSRRELTVPKLDSLINFCTEDEVRNCVSRILSLPKDDFKIFMEEYESRPDGRFSDNLLNACYIVNKMRQDWPNMFD